MTREKRIHEGIAGATFEGPRPRVLALGSDDTLVQAEVEVLHLAGYLIERAASVNEAARMLRRFPVDVVISDLDQDSTRELLSQTGRIDPYLPVLIWVVRSNLPSVVQAIDLGAFDCIAKPLQEQILLNRVLRACEIGRLRGLVRGRGMHDHDRPGDLQGVSRAIQALCWRIEEVGPTFGSVMIQGEPGTNKTVVAREIHRLSALREAPFTAISCDEPSQASWERVRRSLDGDGTLFLRQVQRLPRQTQRGLADLFKERQVQGAPPMSADAIPRLRVISSATLTLERELEDGTFPADLYCQLADSLVRVPPLRERVEDIEILSNRILATECARQEKGLSRLSPRSLELLSDHDWPGNIAELRAILHAAVTAGTSRIITPHDLGEFEASHSATVRLRTLAQVENAQIETALKQAAGNVTRAAKMLGISRSTFYRRMGTMQDLNKVT